MAEYSRERRNQQSRAVANCGSISKQLKKKCDNNEEAPQEVTICNYISKQSIQRQIIFGDGAKDLDIEDAENKDNVYLFDSAYTNTQRKAKELSELIIISSGSVIGAQAKFTPKKDRTGGYITVNPLPDMEDMTKDNIEYTRTGRTIALTHETQHAIDFLTDAPLKDELRDLTGKKGVRTELHAFAAQAATTKQLVDKGIKVEVKLRDMADAFIKEEPNELLFNIMRFYAWNYSNKFKENNPKYELLSEQGGKVLDECTKQYIDEYFKEALAIYKSLLPSS